MNLILVPLDTSEVAAEALEPAMELADALDKDILLLTVGDVVVSNAMQNVMDSEHLTADQAMRAYLDQVAADLGGTGVEIETMVIESHDAAAAISEAAEAKGADMIVMCSHGRSGAARWLLGSTADRVVHSSRVPVHLVPVR